MQTQIQVPALQSAKPLASVRPATIWIDLDNSPHVPFFAPIIEELKNRGHAVFLTARDSYQVCELLEYYGISAVVVGKHYGKLKILKLLGTFWRACQLTGLVRKHRPDIALSHGSRGCMLVARILGIKNITIFDYEFATKLPIFRAGWLLCPELVANERRELHGAPILSYPGIKEDVYLSRFRPDPALRTRLGIAEKELLIAVRPPATEAHYHNPEGEALLTEVMTRFAHDSDTRLLLLPRNKRQEHALRTAWGAEIASGRVIVPGQVEDGLNIIWNSDLVISGGGTMNREAAAMGVPVYSIFRGKIGAVDRYLADQGRLILLESAADVRTKIKAVWRQKSELKINSESSAAFQAILQHITNVLQVGAAR